MGAPAPIAPSSLAGVTGILAPARLDAVSLNGGGDEVVVSSLAAPSVRTREGL